MSIPKEPRQILINLMYIVLTAMLALNVSAEIMNAFLLMDKSIHESSRITSYSNNKLIDAINKQADTYIQFSSLKEKAIQAKNISKDFDEYVNLLREMLIEESGGFDENGEPKGIKNKDVTTRLLVTEGQGDELEKAILIAREELLALIEEETMRKILANSIPLKVNEIPANSDNESAFYVSAGSIFSITSNCRFE